MDGGTTYDVRVYRTGVHQGSRVTTNKVRWKVGGRLWKAGFEVPMRSGGSVLAQFVPARAVGSLSRGASARRV